MKIEELKTCSYRNASFQASQATSPPRGYQAQSISRCNPGRIPCASCGSTERKLGVGKVPGGASLRCSCNKFVKWLTPSEVAKINNQEQGGQI